MFKRVFCLLLMFCLLGPFAALAADDTYCMTTSEAGIAFIKYYEGFNGTVYVDSSGYAIGYGTHCNPADFPDPITEAQGDELLREAVAGMETKLNAALRKMGAVLTQNQFDALISLTYNLGAGWLSTGYSLFNMLAAGIGRYSDDQIINTFGRYCHVNGEIMDQVAWRRLAEAKLFLYSDYKSGGTQNYEYEVVDDPEAESDILFKAEGGLTICTFSDVNYCQWYYPYLSPLSFCGVIGGYDDGTFRPDREITCGEALKLILLAAGYDTQAAADGHWAGGYLAFAEDNAIIVRGDITDLDAPVSRSLMAEIAANALRLSVPVTTASAASAVFSDTGDGYVLALYEAEIVTGSYDASGSRVFLPDESLKRSEICAIVWRIMQYR